MTPKPNKPRLTRPRPVAMIIRPPVLRELSRISRETRLSQQAALDIALEFAFSERGRDEWQRTDWSETDA